jgi:hypothetical protein
MDATVNAVGDALHGGEIIAHNFVPQISVYRSVADANAKPSPGGEGGPQGRVWCSRNSGVVLFFTPHQSKIKDFCQLLLKEKPFAPLRSAQAARAANFKQPDKLQFIYLMFSCIFLVFMLG